MLTIFTTAKPFHGHSGVIQRNALESWGRLHPDVEIILFGDEEGAADVALELGIRHEPEVKRDPRGMKYLTPIFDRAQELARHDVVCYSNCDIVLTSDFRQAVVRVAEACARFLMVGQRWDTSVTKPLDFLALDWEERLRRLAFDSDAQRPPGWVDYFVFRRGLYYRKTPDFVIGRPSWDSWLVWYARHSGATVVDASESIVAVHQNHDYSYHPKGEIGVWADRAAIRNQRLAGWWRMGDVRNATHRLLPDRLEPVPRSWKLWRRQMFYDPPMRAWYMFLAQTLPLRHRLGICRTPQQRAVSR